MSRIPSDVALPPTPPPTIPVFVIERPELGGLVIATLSLLERWRRCIGDVEMETRFELKSCPPDELSAALAGETRLSVLVDGGWVFDTLGVERAIEAGLATPAGGLSRFSAPKSAGLAPMIVLGEGGAARLSAIPDLGKHARAGLDAIAAHSGQTVSIRPLDDAYFYAAVTGPSDAKKAEWGLLKRLQWRPGGLVAKYLNRPISIRIFRHLANTRITPNQTTFVAFVLGAIGVVLLAFAPNWPLALIGALFLQSNSVVDGIDGELARLRHQKSEFGAFFDSICDEILNALMYAAIGWHLAHTDYSLLTGDLIPRSLYFPLGAFAGCVSFTYALTQWHCKLKHGLGFYWWWEAYKPRKVVQRSTSFFTYFKKIFWKESTLFLLVWAAAFRLLNVYVVAGAIAAVPVATLWIIHLFILRERW